MASVNKVILVGNLGADPETRYTPGGDAVCNIRLATTDSWKDKDGQDRYTTEIEATEFQMLGNRGGGGGDHSDSYGGGEPSPAPRRDTQGGGGGNGGGGHRGSFPDPDDIPFIHADIEFDPILNRRRHCRV